MKTNSTLCLHFLFLITVVFFSGCTSERGSDYPPATDVDTDSSAHATSGNGNDKFQEIRPSCSTERGRCTTTGDCCPRTSLNCVDSQCIRCANQNQRCGDDRPCCSEDFECNGNSVCVQKLSCPGQGDECSENNPCCSDSGLECDGSTCRPKAKINFIDREKPEVVPGPIERETESCQIEYSRGYGRIKYERNVNENIAIFVTNDVYNSLSAEIERYKRDIEREWHNKYRQTDVAIIKKDSFTKEYIKDCIKNLWKNQNLSGVVLIGDIPYYNFRYDAFRPFDPEYLKDTPSDFYYVDLEDSCEYPYPYNCTRPKIWLGRITPPVKNDVSLLKDYFDRNNAYRTGRLQYNNEMLTYRIKDRSDPSEVDSLTEWILGANTDYRPFFDDRFTVDEHTVIMSGQANPEDDAMFFEELKKPYKYVHYNGHGVPKSAEYNITPDLIKAKKPQALYYHINSCSNGDFTVENYNAGWYLFSGKGLVVTGLTEPTWAGYSPYSEAYTIAQLERGLSFGEMFGLGTGVGRSQSVATTLLGDPTLHIYDKIPSDAEFRLSNKSIRVNRLSEIIRIPIKIRNVGSENLKFYEIKLRELDSLVRGCGEFKDYGEPQHQLRISPCTISGKKSTHEIEPNSEMTFELFLYSELLDQDRLLLDPVTKDKYLVFKAFTNDKYQPFIRIPVYLSSS